MGGAKGLWSGHGARSRTSSCEPVMRAMSLSLSEAPAEDVASLEDAEMGLFFFLLPRPMVAACAWAGHVREWGGRARLGEKLARTVCTHVDPSKRRRQRWAAGSTWRCLCALMMHPLIARVFCLIFCQIHAHVGCRKH